MDIVPCVIIDHTLSTLSVWCKTPPPTRDLLRPPRFVPVSRSLTHAHPRIEAPAATVPLYSCFALLFSWCAYPDAPLVVVLVFRYGNAYIECDPHGQRCRDFDTITPDSDPGAESQGGPRSVETTVDKAERAAQACDRLSILP
jgi:hypothetical protein